jgi:2-haloacid dehalogenase
MYETILFDLDDTLVDFQQSQSNSLKQLHAQFYADIDYIRFEKLYKPINRALWERVGCTKNPITPNEIKSIRFAEIHKQLNIDRDTALIAEAFEQLLGSTAEWIPEVKSVVELLHEKGHHMGIITNGLHDAQHRKYELLELKKWFHAFIVSETAGIAKPHQHIFELALSKMPVTSNRESVLMVGDSLHHDGHGAKNAGIHFCFVQRQPSAMKTRHDIPVQYKITSVADLPKILGY